MSISRRRFLETTALGSVAGPSLFGAGKMPTRVLGKTGARVSILAFGCGSRFLMYEDDEKAAQALNRALDLGITYVDTAYGYGNGQSETRVGKVMATRRKEVFLATKMSARKADDLARVFDASLKRLQTDHVDLLHIHSLGDQADLAAIKAPDGAYKAIQKIRDQKMARFIGITCHDNPAMLKQALEELDFDVTQMALNAGLAGMAPPPKGERGYSMNHMLTNSFQALALPVANRKKMGVIAMKIFGQEKLLGAATVDQLVQYSMSLPVTAVVAGMPKVEHIEHNIQLAKNFKPMPQDEMRKLSLEIASKHKASLDLFFSNHVDA
jgi:uncharacterized protein